MRAFFLAAMLAALLPLSANAEPMSNADMAKQIERTNFLVNGGCSGTLIDAAKGYVLTASHCILDQYETVEREKIDSDGKVTKEKVRIARPGTVSQLFFKGPAEVQRNSYVYKIVASDSALDLALLQVQTKLPYAKGSALACVDVSILDRVYAVGNPYGVLYSSVTSGEVSSLTRSYLDLGIAGDLGDATDNGEHGLVQHSAIIAPGNSGGALYNENGDLVGVNVRGGRSGFSFSVPLSDIHKFLVGVSDVWECK